MTKCWICGELADSEEHKFKASDIKRNYGKKFEAFYIREEITPLLSYKDKVIKFPKVICQECNVVRTRKHDVAYDVFIKYIECNYEKLINLKSIDFKDIYGEFWSDEKRNLYRYYAKHAGCKIQSGQYPQNLEKLAEFIKGNLDSNVFLVKFELKTIFYHLHKHFNKTHRYVHLFNAEIIYFGRDKFNLSSAGWTSYNWMTANWVFSSEISNEKVINFDNQKEEIDIDDFMNYYSPNLKSGQLPQEMVIEYEYGIKDTFEKRVKYFMDLINWKYSD